MDRKNNIHNEAKIRIVGIADGDPFDQNTWSGSSLSLFERIDQKGVLEAGISGLPPEIVRKYYQIINFNFTRKSWEFKFNIDTRYYKAFTRKVANELTSIKNQFTHTLQIYSHYDVPSVTRGRNIVNCAYQDGNLACLLKSPFGYPKISKKYIHRALQWEKKVFGNLDYIFTFSEWLRQSFIEDYNVAPDKVRCVGAGANLPIANISQKKKFDDKNILFIGIDFKRKGGDVLLNAFKKVKKKIPNAKLKIVGPILQDIPSDVKCIGYISKNSANGIKKLKKLYVDANVFVMPSLYEPFGVVFLEAMAHGIPCIGTFNCAMPEIIDNNVSGILVPPGDSDSLANGIIEILSDPIKAKNMGKMGKQKLDANFTWDRVADKIIRILSNH